MKQQLFLIALIWCAVTGAVKPGDIFWAAINNNTELAQQCIDTYGVEILKKRCLLDSATPLHDAALHNAQEAAQLIIERSGLKLLETKDDWGNTPLHKAARNKARKTVRLLLSLNANIQARNNDGKKPIDLTWSDKTKQPFIQQQEKLNQQLLDATQENNLESIILALNGGARIDTCDKSGKTALHHATLQGDLTFIKRLLGRGADPKVYDNKGEFAVHIAVGEPERLIPFIEAAFGQRLYIKEK